MLSLTELFITWNSLPSLMVVDVFRWKLHVWLGMAYQYAQKKFEPLYHVISRIFAPKISLFHGNKRLEKGKNLQNLPYSGYIQQYRFPRSSFDHV